jgi:hypothetical protein
VSAGWDTLTFAQPGQVPIEMPFQKLEVQVGIFLKHFQDGVLEATPLGIDALRQD